MGKGFSAAAAAAVLAVGMAGGAVAGLPTARPPAHRWP